MFDSDEYADPDDILGGSQPEPPIKKKRGRKPNPVSANGSPNGKKAGRKRRRGAGDEEDIDDEGVDMQDELGAGPSRTKQSKYLEVGLYRIMFLKKDRFCLMERLQTDEIISSSPPLPPMTADEAAASLAQTCKSAHMLMSSLDRLKEQQRRMFGPCPLPCIVELNACGLAEVLQALLYSQTPVKADAKPAIATLQTRYAELRAQLGQLRTASDVRCFEQVFAAKFSNTIIYIPDCAPFRFAPSSRC
jgi:hypothetical protein